MLEWIPMPLFRVEQQSRFRLHCHSLLTFCDAIDLLSMSHLTISILSVQKSIPNPRTKYLSISTRQYENHSTSGTLSVPLVNESVDLDWTPARCCFDLTWLWLPDHRGREDGDGWWIMDGGLWRGRSTGGWRCWVLVWAILKQLYHISCYATPERRSVHDWLHAGYKSSSCSVGLLGIDGKEK